MKLVCIKSKKKKKLAAKSKFNCIKIKNMEIFNLFITKFKCNFSLCSPRYNIVSK